MFIFIFHIAMLNFVRHIAMLNLLFLTRNLEKGGLWFDHGYPLLTTICHVDHG